LGRRGNDEAAATADWTDEEGFVFAIHPAKGLVLADTAVGGKGYTYITNQKASQVRTRKRWSSKLII
jgi:hypothetical protein